MIPLLFGAAWAAGPLPIVHGAPEPSFPAAVALDYGFARCTGSLVTPRVVLTAAHCVVDLPVEDALVLVGADVYAPDHELPVERGVVHPEYVPLGTGGARYPSHDLAVVILDDDAPPEIEPVWFRTRHLGDRKAEGAVVTSVGYGLDELGASGVKRSAELVIDHVQDEFLVSFAADNEGGASTCSGDSGGPQYHVEEDGTIVQWAVHSWSDSACAVMEGSTLVDPSADWLLGVIADVHGTSDVCELFDRYDDGACDEDCDAPDPDCVVAEPEAPEPVVPEPVAEEPGGCSTAPGGSWLGGLALLALARRRTVRAG